MEFAEFRSNAGAVLSRAGEREGRTAVAGRGTAAWFWGAPNTEVEEKMRMKI